MTISLKHAFTSAVADGADATKVRASNWNAEHALLMATARILGRVTAADGAAEELTAAQVAEFVRAAGFSGTLAVSGAINGVTLDNNAWATYTPTISAGSGTFTTVSATGRYKVLGKTVFIVIEIVDTTNGTASDYIEATLPHTVPSHTILSGFANGSNFGVHGNIGAGSAAVDIFTYNGGYPGASGNVITICGVYEIA